jgi:hypothetical protein
LQNLFELVVIYFDKVCKVLFKVEEGTRLQFHVYAYTKLRF